MKKLAILALPLLLLASCGGNPQGLPASNQEVVDYVAKQSLAVLNNGQHLRFGEDESNTIAHQELLLLKSWEVDVWSDGKSVKVTADITWTATPSENWDIYTLKGNYYTAEPLVDTAFDSVFTGTITYSNATATVTLNVSMLAK